MKRLGVLLLLVVVAGSLAALDIGGYLDNTSGYRTPPSGAGAGAGLVQETIVAGWLTHNLGMWVLDAQASYTFTPAVPLLFDLDSLTLSRESDASAGGAATFGVTFGRSNFRDATGYVLNHTLDGALLRVAGARSVFSVVVGTTAALQKPTNQIILSPLDVEDLSNPDKLFAPPRLIVTAEYELIDVLAAQSITLGATAQEDLRPAAELTPVGRIENPEPNAAGKVDTQYLTLAVNGAIAQGLFHETYYTFNSGRYLADLDPAPAVGDFAYQSFAGHMAGTELTLFLPDVLNSRARLFGQWSSGETSWSNTFVPLSPSSYSDVFSLQPGNSAHIGLSYSVRPLAATGADILQAELGTVAYFEGGGTGYVGTDIDVSLTLVPLSDVRLVLKNGVFVPNASVVSTGVAYQGTLQGVLRF
jgi:hypothetical protein